VSESKEIRLSVIVPCYNVERWLERCLNSVFAALPPDVEVLAVDDASTDGTFSVLQTRAAAESRLRVLQIPHAGVSAARNRALDEARGRYVFFVDPDDAVAPDFFTAMVTELERANADCCLCGYGEREDGSEGVRVIHLKDDYRYRSQEEILAGYLPRIFGYSFDDIRAWYRGVPLFTRREMASACRVVYRREILARCHIRFDETVSLFEDAMFNAEYLLASASMTSIDRPLYLITNRSSGAMSSVPRDGARYCRNKLALLRKREALDRQTGGRLAPLYAATSVLSVLEILTYALRRLLALSAARQILKAYCAVPSVREAIAAFPLSFRRPLLALAVLVLRAL